MGMPRPIAAKDSNIIIVPSSVRFRCTGRSAQTAVCTTHVCHTINELPCILSLLMQHLLSARCLEATELSTPVSNVGSQ